MTGTVYLNSAEGADYLLLGFQPHSLAPDRLWAKMALAVSSVRTSALLTYIGLDQSHPVSTVLVRVMI